MSSPFVRSPSASLLAVFYEIREYYVDYKPVDLGFAFLFHDESGWSCHSALWQVSGWNEAGLISPSGLVIAVTIIRQVADVGPIHTHDEDIAGLWVFF